MVHNPLWPLIDEAISFPTGPNSTMPAPYWCSVIARTEGQTTVSRGKQYELDQTQAGTSTVTLRNDDGAFDSDNTASPFYPQVTLYRAHRRRAQYPPTVNLLTADQATAFFASKAAAGVGNTLPQWVAQVGTQLVNITAAGATNAYTIHYANAAAIGQGFSLTGFSVTPGASHTAQVSALQNTVSAVTCQLSIQWIGPTGTVISTSTGAAVAITLGAQTLTVTATAPANACGAVLQLLNTTLPAAAILVSAKFLQVEQNNAASAWAQPGTWYDMINDYVAAWPQDWTDGGTYGISNLECVDAFGYLSQRKLLSPAYMELLQLNPTFFYPLDEGSSATQYSDLTANNPPIGTILSPGSLASQVIPGSTLQATGGWLPQGIGGPVVTFTNPSSGLTSASLNLGDRGTVGPPTATAWTRVYAFRLPAVPSQNTFLWAVTDPSNGQTGQWSFSIGGSVPGAPGQAGFALAKNGAFIANVNVGSPNVADGGWHLVILAMAANGLTLNIWLDGVNTNTITNATDMRPTMGPGAVETFGGTIIFNANSLNDGFIGDGCYVAELPFAATPAQASQIYSTFRFGGSGLGSATSATRYADILRWGGWQGLQAEDNFTTGETTAYGPATELLAAADQAGTDVVSALQTVVDTDNGAHFVSQPGAVTFKARRSRYNMTLGSPQATFGENTGAGEIPYTTGSFRLDPSRVANDAAITQTTAGTAVRVTDPTSIGTFGDIQLQRSVNTLNALEVADAANYLVQRNRTPKQRLQQISVDVGSNPGAWATLLALELGEYVRVMRRPPNAPAIQFDGIVEQLNWTMDDQNGAHLDLMITPLGIGQNLSQLTASRGPLNASVLAGATSIVVNVPTDAGGNTPQQNGWTASAITFIILWNGAASAGYSVASMTYAGQLVTINLATPLNEAWAAPGTTVSENTIANAMVNGFAQFDSVALLDGTHALAY